jgi:hypothetical protein
MQKTPCIRRTMVTDEKVNCRKSRLVDKGLGKDQRVYYWNTAHQ